MIKIVRITGYEEVEIPNGDGFINVELEGLLTLENDGIGAYEFWGQKGYDKGVDYFVLDDVKYITELYDEPTQEIINQWIDENWEYLCSLFEEGKAVDDYFNSLYDKDYREEDR